MPAISGGGFLLVVVELLCGAAIGSILAAVLINAIDPLIVFIIIIATIIAILDFADYLPAFSLAYFAGYLGEFLYPVARAFGDLKIPVLILALIGMAVVVVTKAGGRKDTDTL
jgi:hypothetical protein